MEVGVVRRIDIDAEMQQAYLDYAMSVIVSRAIPDARDGLKPVHRRILYAMHDMGLRPDAGYKKSARIVGEVLGKYHPHGDAPVYEAMSRMAQDFSMRYRLVDGQGNFGSVDGDAPAAMRYTEARLALMALDLLGDIEKGTVDFGPNFDDTLTEPAVLPSAIPNLLVNGSSGIAVGMATSIPPHNLGEVCDALNYMLERWNKLDDVTVDDLMQFIKGPDFPTGGVIVRAKQEEEGLAAAYGAGKGKVLVQAKAHVEDIGRGRSRIIVTELPYQTNKAALIERIADLVREGSIEGIADLRDESDRQGMRIVVEVAKTAEPEKIIRDLFKRTPMQGTFGITMLALVTPPEGGPGQPRVLTLKQALRVYLDHRLEVVRRRSEHDLARAKERAHILEGLLTALKNLDEVIRIIRHAKDSEEARAKLVKRFKFSEAQVQAILDMPLRRLAALERQKIEGEYKEKKALIKRLAALLGSPKLMREAIQAELREVRRKYGDPRRTQIVEAGEGPALTAADLVPSEKTWVTVTAAGTISRTPAPAGKPPKPSAGAAPVAVLGATTKDTLYLITLKGRAASAPVYALPEKEDPADGAPFPSVSALDAAARIVAAVAVPPLPPAGEVPAEDGAGGKPSGYLFLGTQGGTVKKIALEDLPGPSSQVYNVMNVAEGDGVVAARLTSGQDDILLVSALGQAIRFNEGEVRAMGLAAAGVMGIKLSSRQDQIVGLDVMRPRADVLLATDNGQAKRTSPAEFPTQGRYGVGVIAWKLPGQSRLVGACTGYADSRVSFVTAKGAAKTEKFEAAPRRGRAARGGAVIKLKEKDSVVRLVPHVAAFEVEAPPPPKAKKGSGAKAKAKKKGEGQTKKAK